MLLYGCFFYPLYTLGTEQLFRVVEAAVTAKCEELGAPSKAMNRFETKLAYLRDEGWIPAGDWIRWDATRHLRNATSHPEDQTIVMPNEAMTMLTETAEQINALFPSEHSSTGDSRPRLTAPSREASLASTRGSPRDSRREARAPTAHHTRAVVQLHVEGWTATSTAEYLETSRQTVYTTLKPWTEEEFAGMPDKSRVPHRRGTSARS